MLSINLFRNIERRMAMKTKLVSSREKLKYCDKAIPGLAEKILAKEESLNSSALKIDQEWRQKQSGYFCSKIRFGVLKFVTESTNLSKDLRNFSIKDKHTVEEISQNLRISNKQNFQGLFDPFQTKSKLSDSSTEVVKTEMKMKLLETFRDLLSHYRSQNDTETNNINSSVEVYKRSIDLVNLIKNDLNCLEKMENDRNSKYDEDTDINAELQKQKTLEEHFHILNQIVDIHLTDRMPQTKHYHADNLAAKVTL